MPQQYCGSITGQQWAYAFWERIRAATIRPAHESCNSVTRACIRLIAMLRFWQHPSTPTGNLFRSRINFQGRWEGNSWLTISKRKVRKALTCNITWAWCAVATCISFCLCSLAWAAGVGCELGDSAALPVSTLILVEQPTMPKDYVTPNVNDDLQERMQSITQQILSRTRLLHIIDQYNLYASEHTQRSPDQKVDSMRKDIQIDLVRDNGNQITAFNVYYTSPDPGMAQKVTSELTNLFINENLEVRQQQSEDTTKFLESQLESARNSLSDQENRIREFKAQHVGEMPGQLASNLQILQGLQSQLQNEEDALNSARQQNVYLQTLADQYRALQGSAKNADGTTAGLPAIRRGTGQAESAAG